MKKPKTWKDTFNVLGSFLIHEDVTKMSLMSVLLVLLEQNDVSEYTGCEWTNNMP